MIKKIILDRIKGDGFFSISVSFFDYSPSHTVKNQKLAILSTDSCRSHSGLSENEQFHLPIRSHTRGMMNGAQKYACFGAKYDSNRSNVPPTVPMAILILDSTSPSIQLSVHIWCLLSHLAPPTSYERSNMRRSLFPPPKSPSTRCHTPETTSNFNIIFDPTSPLSQLSANIWCLILYRVPPTSYERSNMRQTVNPLVANLDVKNDPNHSNVPPTVLITIPSTDL